MPWSCPRPRPRPRPRTGPPRNPRPLKDVASLWLVNMSSTNSVNCEVKTSSGDYPCGVIPSGSRFPSSSWGWTIESSLSSLASGWRNWHVYFFAQNPRSFKNLHIGTLLSWGWTIESSLSSPASGWRNWHVYFFAQNPRSFKNLHIGTLLSWDWTIESSLSSPASGWRNWHVYFLSQNPRSFKNLHIGTLLPSWLCKN